MKYDCIVNYNGVYYNAGEDVPIEDEGKDKTLPSLSEESTHVYSEDELRQMPVREIRQVAQNIGITITKTLKDDVISEFISKQANH